MEIRLAGIGKRYRPWQAALTGVSLAVTGGACALVGPNGSGKTTLLRILATHLAPSAGRAWLGGFDLARPADRVAARRDLGYVPQELSLPERMRVGDWLEEIALLKGLRDRFARREQIAAVLADVGLASRAATAIGTLAAGERRRLVIAQALLGAPRLLLLDEPFAGLDAEQRRDLAALLLGDPHRTVICATHLAEEWLPGCDSCVVLRGGRVAYAGRVADLPSAAGAPTLAGALLRLMAGGDGPAMERMTAVSMVSLPATTPATSDAATGLTIRVANVTRRYGATRALDDVSLTIPPGVFGLLGRNGAGKTTLLQIIATLLEPSAGTVAIGPFDARRDCWPIRRRLGYLPQEHGFYPSFTVRETLRYFATLQGLRSPGPAVARALAAVNLTDRAAARVGTLSGGLRRRLGLAQALLGDPPVVIVDEPTAGLDPIEQQRFRALLGALGAQGDRTILLSTHIVEDVEAAAGQVAILERGRVAFSGSVADLRARAHERAWTWRAALAEVEARRAAGLAVVSIAPLADQPGLVEARTVGASPAPQAAAREPTLTDGYFAVLAEQEAR